MPLNRAASYYVWDVLLAVSMTFAAVEIPLRYVLDYEPSWMLVVLDWCLIAILCFDVFVRWRRPSESVGRFLPSSTTPKRIWSRTWFSLDVLAAFPFEGFAALATWPLLHLVKLARVAQHMQRWRRHEIQYANILRLVFFIYWLLLTSHWLACGWIALGGSVIQTDKASQYLRALYWCITTLATVGYGDVVPQTNAQTVYAMIAMLIGVGVYGYVIGNVTSLLANIDLAQSHYMESMERLTAFMRYRNIPPLLQRRLRDYHAYLWENRMGFDEQSVLAELPDSLRSEVALFLRRDFIEHAPLFKGASHELVREMALELRPVVFTPGDYIFRAGQYGRHMYFISHGSVEIVSPDGQTVVNTLHDGDFFGELALLFSQSRSASVRAVNYCDLYTLDKDTFDRVLAHYPDFAAHIRGEAERRQVPRES